MRLDTPSRILSFRIRLYSEANLPQVGSDSSKNVLFPISSAGIGVFTTASWTELSAPNESKSWHQAEKTASCESFLADW